MLDGGRIFLQDEWPTVDRVNFSASLHLAALVSASARLLALFWLAGLASGQPRVVINEIHFEPADKKSLEFIELHNAGTAEAHLGGWLLGKFRFNPTNSLAPGGFAVVAADPAAFQKAFGFAPLGPLVGRLKNEGERVALRDAGGRVVDEVRYGVGFPWPSATMGAGSSLERMDPGLPATYASSWRASGFRVDGSVGNKSPTPGKTNTVFSVASPPAVEVVSHTPQQPRSGEAVTVTVRVAELRGYASAKLLVQVVEPGSYIRKSDPAYEQGWQEFALHDDGKGGDARAQDNTLTAVVPGEFQKHRRLLRYRVIFMEVSGLNVRLPYTDDESPNFAWFCYDGVPAWTGASQPGKTPPLQFSSEFLTTIPVYHLLARHDDVERSQWDGGYNKRRLFGTFVCDGQVFDHVQFQNRGQASTYVSGKTKWGIHFARTHEFTPKNHWGEPYVRPWDHLNLSGCASPWVQVNRGMAGMDEAVSFRAHHLAGVPSPATHWLHWRVISRAEEASAKSQYDGDLWGLYMVVQDPDGPWLKERGLPDGNTFSPETGKKHIAAALPKDGSDFNQFMHGSRTTKSEQWWRENLNLPDYYSFHAVNRIVSNVDLRHGANHFLYHSPRAGWSPVPWDLDMMFIPKTHWPGIVDQSRCLELPALKLEYQNRAREILDLFCSDVTPSGGQVGQLVEELARAIRPAGQGRTWAELDMAMWNHHPRTSQKGAFYQTPYEQGMMGGNFRRVLATPDFNGFCKLIADFCTDSRTNRNYAPNDGNILGYGFGHLWWESRDAQIPERPVIRHLGSEKKGSQLFQITPFTTPVATNHFAVVQWRVGRSTAPGQPGYRAGQPWRYEIEPHWDSGEQLRGEPQMKLPKEAFTEAGLLRVRARYRDNTGRWSHWSEPVTLTVR